MKTIIKIILISLLAITTIFLLVKMAVSFFNPESTTFKKSFIVQKPKSLSNIVLLSIAPPIKEDEEKNLPSQINFLLLGLPGQNNNAPNLSDTIMLAALKPQEKKIYFFSIPRDLYVKNNEENFVKINSLYAFGKNKNIDSPANYIIHTIEEITGQKVNYFLTIDLTAIEKIVDDFGGLNVNVSETVQDPKLLGVDNDYEDFYIEKGWRYFDGKTTLRYLRTRNSLRGDFDRMRRQQDILEAFRKKIFGFNILWDFPKIIKTYLELQNHIQTNMNFKEIQIIYKIMREIPSENIAYQVIDGEKTGLVTAESINIENDLIISIVRPQEGLEKYEKIWEFIEKFINQ